MDFPLVTTALTLLLFHFCSAVTVVSDSVPPPVVATPLRQALMFTCNEKMRDILADLHITWIQNRSSQFWFQYLPLVVGCVFSMAKPSLNIRAYPRSTVERTWSAHELLPGHWRRGARRRCMSKRPKWPSLLDISQVSVHPWTWTLAFRHLKGRYSYDVS